MVGWMDGCDVCCCCCSPGTKPTAITRPSAPLRVADISETLFFSTSSAASSTALASIAAPFSIIAPRISIFDSESFFAALARVDDTPTTLTPEVLARSERARRPVCPVAPATTTFLISAA